MRNTEMTIIDHLTRNAVNTAQAAAFIMPAGGVGADSVLSCADLYNQVRQLGSQLVNDLEQGERVLLVYGDVLEFTRAFLACLYAGVTAVPVFYTRSPRQLARLTDIMEDAGITTVLCTAGAAPVLRNALANALPSLYCTDGTAENIELVPCRAGNTLAFIQYTSGSTGLPKGVMVSHENLLHNQGLLATTFGCTEESVILSWLPFHHDMGLIGNILHGIYIGCTVVLMSPFRFMQQPFSWLENISRYRVTHSGGPNFAYDLCVSKITPADLVPLDLSCWKVAYNGAEPVRPETMQRFAAHCAAAGFSDRAFSPCYGLAEATLLVSGCTAAEAPFTIYVDKQLIQSGTLRPVTPGQPGAKLLVSSGRVVPGMELKIVSPVTGTIVADGEEGEICIAGTSVTAGYYNKSGNHLFYQFPEGQYLKTGDTGFLYQKQLFVSGRIKEMLIIRGQNYYPYDLELVTAECHEAVVTNGVAAFGLDEAAGLFGIVAEINRTALQHLDAAEVFRTVDAALTAAFGIAPHDIILVPPLTIPRTTSGKLQRTQCRSLYDAGAFKTLASKQSVTDAIVTGKDDSLREAVRQHGERRHIEAYLFNLLAVKTGHVPQTVREQGSSLSEMGLDSLRIMELINTINTDLDIELAAEDLLTENTVTGLVNTIEAMIWLQCETIAGNEIYA